jgi:hypothetical protein
LTILNQRPGGSANLAAKERQEVVMKAGFQTALRCAASAVVWLVAAVGTPVHAQVAPAAGEKVSGAQLQAWLDEKFSYAGVHKASQCVILNVAQGAGRMLSMHCPNGWAEKLSGTARVVGDSYCTSFPIPNTPPGQDCVTWHSVGQWRFEQRKASELDTTVIVLPQGLTPSR